MKKYILTNEKKEFWGKTLYRIQAVRSFGNVREGEKGGWIEKEEDLSHDGNCWVYENALVFGNAQIFENARVRENARIFENARVRENAQIFGDARVCENARIFGDALVFGNAQIFENARAYGNAQIFENARAYGHVWICENARVFGKASVHGDAQIFGTAQVFGDALVSGKARVFRDARIFSSAVVEKTQDFIYFSPIGSRFGSATFYKNKNKGISVCCGCFNGTIEEFQNQVAETHGSNKFAKEYNLAIELAKIHVLGGKDE